MIKKIAFYLLVSLFVLSILPASKALAISPGDQECVNGPAVSPNYYRIDGHGLAQVFTPSKNRLDGVGVYIAAISQTAKVRLDVWDANTPQGRLIASATQGVNNSETWVTYDFADVAVQPNLIYMISLTTISGTQAIWKITDQCGYSRGYAKVDSRNLTTQSFGFVTYGYDSNSEPGSPPSGSTGGTAPTTGISGGNGSAPATNTDPAIAAPSGVVAEDVPFDNGGAIKVTWNPSAAASVIDGYRVFRSQSETSGFTEIYQTLPIVGGVIDNQAQNDVTYYYMARAYKGNAESASSNFANAKAIDDIGAILNDYKNSDHGGVGILGIFSPLLGAGMSVLFLILLLGAGFVFLVVIIIIIIVVVRRRSSQTPSSTQNLPKK